MKTTDYFETVTLIKHPEVRREWCERVLAEPLATEVQADGRVFFWGFVPEFGNRALRVVTLEDGKTVHNAFFDRNFLKRYLQENQP